jgi:hypothetical protein
VGNLAQILPEARLPDHPSHIWFALERHERQLSQGDGWRSAFDSMGRPQGSYSGFGADFGNQLSRVERVRLAIADSGDLARQIIASRLTGISLSAIWDILIGTCQEIALYYGGSVVAGASVGAAGGAFFGGVGAIPGGVAGATVGAEVGSWIMALLGLKSLAEGLATAIPEALEYYERGFREAWGPTHRDRQSSIQVFGAATHGNVRHAAFAFANGHVVMMMAILTALMAYVSRGKGGKAVVMQEIRESQRLGPQIAQWIGENEQRLASHPALQSRRKTTAADAGIGEPATVPSKRGRQPEEEPRRPAGMPQKKVPCFHPNNLPQASYPEFDRQLAGQEAGLNDMTVEQYLKGREAFKGGETSRDPKVAQQARKRYSDELIEELADRLRKSGMSRRDAEAKAIADVGDKMKTLAALHNPDMIVAGRDAIGDFGDRNINSRIGSQWRSRVGALDQAATAVPTALRARAKMNARLERCK